MPEDPDFLVIGGGSAGCAVAAGLSHGGTVTVVEAGPSDAHPLVRMPFGLVWLLGGRRDWAFRSAPQAALGGRTVAIPRGRMIGGSGSINSMVWFRGRRADFAAWDLPGWSEAEVARAFEEVEAAIRPERLADPHPLTAALGRLFGANDDGTPDPERESAGVFRFNLHQGRRRSAADAFLRPALGRGVSVLTGRRVVRLRIERDMATAAICEDGTELRARRGIVLSSGSIGSPEILLRSGIGPAEELRARGIDVALDAAGVGANLHDHPGVGLHFMGPGSGYGLTADQAFAWAAAPFRYALGRRGRLASPTVEGGAFFNARDDGGAPDVQTHFIPFLLDWEGGKYRYGAGYFADVCLCRPRSRGRLRLASADPSRPPEIDLGLLTDESDLDTLVAGLRRLRRLLAGAPFGDRRAEERFPGPQLESVEALRDHVRRTCGTAYHPVGTLRMGTGDAPVTPRLALAGIGRLWVADASVMPSVTSANTNAPSMMIGHRAAGFILEDAA